MNKEEQRREAVEKLKASGGDVVFIPPQVILGYSPGRALRLSYYARLNMPHPKPQSYYDSLEEPAPDPEIWQIYKGIERSCEIDTPITVYLKTDETREEKILVLDGATRTTCISFVRKNKPNAFKVIPVVLFDGTEDEARREMIMRNVDGRSRALKSHELVDAVGKLHDEGRDEQEIGKVCGINDRSGLTRCCILVHEGASSGVRKAMRRGFLDIMQAARLSRLSHEKQDLQAANAMKGYTIRYDGLDGRAPKKQINSSMGELRRLKGIERKLDNVSDFFTSGQMDPEKARRCRQIMQELYGNLHRLRNRIKRHGEQQTEQDRSG